MFYAISLENIFKFRGCKLWSVFGNEFQCKSVTSKPMLNNFDSFICSCISHQLNFNPFTVTVSYLMQLRLGSFAKISIELYIFMQL